MNEKENLINRLSSLKSELNRAEGIKSSKEKELDKLKQQYKNLGEECFEKFECEPKDLKSKLQSLEKQFKEKVEEAEKLLEELSEEV